MGEVQKCAELYYECGQFCPSQWELPPNCVRPLQQAMDKAKKDWEATRVAARAQRLEVVRSGIDDDAQQKLPEIAEAVERNVLATAATTAAWLMYNALYTTMNELARGVNCAPYPQSSYGYGFASGPVTHSAHTIQSKSKADYTYGKNGSADYRHGPASPGYAPGPATAGCGYDSYCGYGKGEVSEAGATTGKQLPDEVSDAGKQKQLPDE